VTSRTEGGLAVWGLHVHGADVPGRWVIIDRRFVPVENASAGSRSGGRGIGIRSLRKTAINDAIRNGATMHELREFARHADIRTTEVYFVRKEEDAKVAARRIQIRALQPDPRATTSTADGS
jgi:hypothetical protein